MPDGDALLYDKSLYRSALVSIRCSLLSRSRTEEIEAKERNDSFGDDKFLIVPFSAKAYFKVYEFGGLTYPLVLMP